MVISENILRKLIQESINEALTNQDRLSLHVKGDLSVDDIEQGVPLYHRPTNSNTGDKYETIKSLMQTGFSREYTGSNGGNMYGPGVYNVYTLRSSNEKARGYGSFIVRSYLLGGWKDFLVFNIDMAKEVYGSDWEIDKQGMLDPACFIEWQKVESMYKSPLKYLYHLSKKLEGKINLDLSQGPKTFLPDKELREVTRNLCVQLFQQSDVRMLDINSRLRVAKTLRREYASTPKQISRMLHLDADVLKDFI